MNGEKLIHHNSILYLYQKCTHNDSSIIHISLKMRSNTGSVLRFHEESNGQTLKNIEVKNNEFVRNVANLSEIPHTDWNQEN